MDREKQKNAHCNKYNHMHRCAKGLALQCLTTDGVPTRTSLEAPGGVALHTSLEGTGGMPSHTSLEAVGRVSLHTSLEAACGVPSHNSLQTTGGVPSHTVWRLQVECHCTLVRGPQVAH